jgi:diguanylate cyclase (GGDEF)-like protein
MNILTTLKNRSTFFWIITGLVGIALVGAADYLTGRELAFSLFYLIPIMLVAWYAGRIPGLVMSIVSALVWYAADTLAGQAYSQPVIPFWNAAVRLSFFILVTLLLSALEGMERVKEVARLDDLTGAANRRHFFEAAQSELDRTQRYKRPFTMVYIDLDDFKEVNDRWGHQVGDQLLRAVVQRARLQLRKTDFLARLGGDEFIILLPETGAKAAQVTVSKLQHALLDEMQSHHWPVTVSIGALTCLEAGLTPDDLISRTDALMYSVKKSGKNAVVYGIHPG